VLTAPPSSPQARSAPPAAERRLWTGCRTPDSQ
jgi:hypothetical protein